MVGLLVFFIISLVCLKEIINNSYYNDKSKREAIDKNKQYYLDWRGNTRRVDNNHKVCMHTTTGYGDWDTVDIDLKTGEVLRNYTQEEIDEIVERERKFFQEAQKNKEEAIKTGRLYYSSYEPTGRMLQINKTYPYEYVYRRVTDDLLLDSQKTNSNQIYDAKYGFILWRNEKQYKEHPTIYSIENDKRHNQWILSQTNFLEYGTCKPFIVSRQELEEYAKKNGAIL